MRFFDTDELRLLALQKLLGIELPQVTVGPRKFFQTFSSWLFNYQSPEAASRLVVILPEPELNIAFPYPSDEISTAIALAQQGPASEADLVALLKRFGLQSEHLNRPVTALSGGERLLLSFARCSALAPAIDTLVICSPTNWLNRANFVHLQRLLDQYLEEGKRVSLLMLKGEPLPSTLDSAPAVQFGQKSKPDSQIKWTMELESIAVSFEEAHFPKYTPRKDLKYRNIGHHQITLQSPTLLRGNNGVGKSVFAKLASGLLQAEEGSLRIACGGYRGHPRLVMQDCVEQLFGRATGAYFDGVLRFDESRHEEARTLYSDLEESLHHALGADHGLEPGYIGNSENPDSILQARLALVAERLVSRPPLLIMDEPGWRLSQPLAEALLRATVKVAHARGVGVLVISHHEEWWPRLFNSAISLSGENGAIALEALSEWSGDD